MDIYIYIYMYIYISVNFCSRQAIVDRRVASGKP